MVVKEAVEPTNVLALRRIGYVWAALAKVVGICHLVSDITSLHDTICTCTICMIKLHSGIICTMLLLGPLGSQLDCIYPIMVDFIS